jgi:hypothetical protein
MARLVSRPPTARRLEPVKNILDRRDHRTGRKGGAECRAPKLAIILGLGESKNGDEWGRWYELKAGTITIYFSYVVCAKRNGDDNSIPEL